MRTAPHILLVEDDPKLLSTVSDYLQMNGYTITACPDGRSALDVFESHGETISLLLLDGMLPDIDGFDVLRKIRETSEVPVIILSARESERDQLSGFRLGADNYITKPFLFSFSNKILGFVVIFYLIFCSVALYLAISRSVRLVKKVTAVAKQISEKNLSVRYQGKIRSDEIGELAVSVNKMADTIQDAISELENYNFVLREDNSYIREFERTRRLMLRNVTHDLKTPLAVISSQVEMIATCKEQEKKDYYYQSAMEEIGKMSKMISSVLQLTTEERELIRKDAQLLDISALIGELCDVRRAYVESRDLILITDIDAGLQLRGVRDHVEHVFNNYLSNAVQNADRNTEIKVSLKAHDDSIRLCREPGCSDRQ